MTTQSSNQSPGADTFYLACRLFLRLLGLCFLVAFVSSFIQVSGLLGSDGILPVQSTLDELRRNFGPLAWLHKPSLFWLNSSDALLSASTACGIALSVLIVLGILTGPSLLLACTIYGSIVNVGGDFYAFQWDMLLLETGILAMFLTPWRLVEPPLKAGTCGYCLPVLWLLRFLLFRVMFCSGAVKLLSGCPLWRDLSALSYYYQDQLLPNLIAWYAHQLPSWIQSFSLVAGLLLELIVPFCIFAPRKLRLYGAASMIGLQALMALTGNHGFINYLTIVLCVTLLDDAFLKRLMSPALAARFRFVEPAAVPAWRQLMVAVLVTGVLSVTTIQLAQTLGASSILPGFVKQGMITLRNYHLIGGYGLYPWVYPDRTELVVEGSNDLKTWQPYEFKFKVGDTGRAPQIAALYQPRLDWRVRFAAMTRPGECLWFSRFLDKLLTGSPAVLGLMGHNPFPDHPPQFVRANLYTYWFTNPAEQHSTGQWWKRRLQAGYLDARCLHQSGGLTPDPAFEPHK